MHNPPGLATRIIQGARDYQEDDYDFLVLDGDGDGAPGILLVLADGMGGHVAGALASKTVVANFIAAWQSNAGGDDIRARLKAALAAANDSLREKATADPSLAGMGCTLVGVAITQGKLHWLSVGDSPLWLMQGGELQRLNQDHSMAPLLQNLVDAGRMTAAEAAADPRRNALRSAVMGEELTLVDCADAPLPSEPSRVLLASDGVQTLTDFDIADIMLQTAALDADTCAARLLQAVEDKQHPRQDNTTIMVYDPPPNSSCLEVKN